MAILRLPVALIPLTYDRPAQTRYAPAKVQPLYGVGYEADALDEWHFGHDAASLVSVVGNKSTLTPVDQPVSGYGPNYVDIRDGYTGHTANGLASVIADQGVYTAYGVCRRINPTGANRAVIYGNHEQNASLGGSGLEWRLDSLVGVVQNNQPLQSLAPTPGAGAIVFWAHVLDAPNNKAFVYLGGQGKGADVTVTRLASTVARPFAVGCGFVIGSVTLLAPDTYEFGFKPYAATLAQLDSMYARAKTRASYRGYTIF